MKVPTVPAPDRAYHCRGRKFQKLASPQYKEKSSVLIRMYPGTCRRTEKAAAFYDWTVINCVCDGSMRSIKDIHEEIYSHVMACLED